MDFMNSFLPIVIYILLIVLIIVAIIIGIKVILTMNKLDSLVEDVTEKVKTLDRVFELIDFATDKVTIISESVIGYVAGALGKLFGQKKKSSRRKKEAEIDE